MLINFSKERRPSLNRLLNRLYFEKVIPVVEAYKICASTIKNTSTKITPLSEIIKELEELEICEMKKEGNVDYIILKEDGENYFDLMKKGNNSIRINSIFIPIVLNWLHKNNIIEKNILYRSKNELGKAVLLNDLVWDAYGYTNATGLSNLNDIIKSE